MEGCCFDLADGWQLWETIGFEPGFDGLLRFVSQLFIGFGGDGGDVASVAIKRKLHNY